MSNLQYVAFTVEPVGVGAAFSAVDREGRTIWIVDAHRDNGKRFVVHAEEKLPAFIEFECASHTRLRRLMAWHAKM